jgi:TonB-linked SusC/RagA family outer membrane protein
MKKNLTIGDWCPHAVKKALLIMKLTFLLLFVAMLQVSANVNGQGKVSLKLNQVEISKALGSIEKQGTYRFLYNSRLNSISHRISLDVSDEDINAVLGKMFSGTDLIYRQMENNLIVIISNSPAPQDIRITGKVTSATGEAIAGVSVQLKGTTTGTTTDNNGNFALTVPQTGTLVFSSIGFETQEKPITDQPVLNITLAPSTKVIDQVVVVGYGVQRKLDVTGSVGQIKGDEIAKQASVNPISGLQGKMAGVQITNTGTPGSAPDIKIRGLGTYSSNAAPLYVVDGVWVTDVSFLNPSDIESVSVLKDASSEAIYGLRGANGVVLITTRKGKGKTTVNYNGTVGYQVANNIPKMADAHEYAIMFNELTRANGGSTFLDSSQFGKGTDWFAQSLRNAIITNHQVSVNGGNDKSTFNLSLGYLAQQGVLKTNDYDRYTGSFGQDVQLSRFVKTGYSVIGSFSKSKDVPNGIWRALYNAPPVIPVKFSNGLYGDPGYYGLGQVVTNPQVSLDYNNATSNIYHVNANAYLEIRFLDHFTLRSSVGGLYDQKESQNFIPVYNATSTQANTQATYSRDLYSTHNWIIENTLTYSNNFGDHRVTALVGQTALRNFYGEQHGKAVGGSLSPDPSTWFLSNGAGTGSVTDVTAPNAPPQTFPALERISSYFARVTYSYKDRYTVTGTIRDDADSKITRGNGNAYLPSVGAAWILSNESFMQDQHVFNTLKFKGSYGVVGNSGVPVYVGTQTTTTSGSVIYNNTGTISPSQSIASPVPPALNWEKSEGTDAGIEATVANHHLDIEADYYNRNTTNFVFPLLFPASNGYTVPNLPQNIGTLRNRGVELTLNWHDNVNKDFRYIIGGNVAYNQNKFTKNKYGGTQKLYSGGGASTGGNLGTVTTLGQPVGEFYGYKVIGIFQTQDEINGYTSKDGSVIQPNAKPGDLKYAKTAGGGNGSLNGNDRVYLGNPNPRYIYGINTSWGYKAFDLAVDFNGVAGVQLYNANKGLRFGAENWTEDFYKHRWHGAGTSNSNPSVNVGGNQNNYISSWYVESGSYFRIRNVQLGYTLPDMYVTKLGIQKLRVYVNAQNPAIFTKYKGFTPEIGGTPGNIGIDNNVYPVYAIYNFGVNVTF